MHPSSHQKNNCKGNNYKINNQHSRLVCYSSVYYLSTGTGGPIRLNDTLETMKGEIPIMTLKKLTTMQCIKNIK